ncbi:MAG: hypothetical protein UZ15_CFX003000241 [Chloroflexi bacterium OLB15]|nr:MAG: hypothetical protein UZ15_CFX003000241 [Chloroflexi bacterium OLB15]
MADKLDIVLEFNDIKDLFTAPEYDPFDKLSYEAAGLDIIANYLEAHPIHVKASAVIYLPPDQITPDLPVKFQEALKRFKDRRIISNKNAILSNKNDGWRMVIYSTILVFIVTLVSIMLGTVIENEAVVQALFPVVTIILWVIIWQPVEALFFENRPLWRMNRVWKKVATMPFEFKPGPAPDSNIGATGVELD